VIAMLMRTDPFRELDRIARAAFSGGPAVAGRSVTVPLDAYRHGDELVIEFDLPGVDPATIDLSVQRDVLTVRAERRPTAHGGDVEHVVSERSYGSWSRQLFLGDALDPDRIAAGYHAGVLTVRIPVAEQAKPRTISIGTSDAPSRTAIEA
jgi:HSP20 family protein